MRPADNIERLINRLQAEPRSEVSRRNLDDALAAQKKANESADIKPTIWRIIMKSNITKLAAAAVIIIAIIFGFNYLGNSIDGASKVYAAAMNNIQNARTFTCIQTSIDDHIYSKITFKEPQLERYEYLTSIKPESVKEITITDFGAHNQIIIRPAEKTAVLYENNYSYEVDEKTGELKQTELNTSFRDQILEWAMNAVDDMGTAELEGQSVRILQSKNNRRVTTIWINPKTNSPVQIEHKWPGENRPKVLFTSIQIDKKLDDSLFSFKPPEGYSFKRQTIGLSDYQRKIVTKTKHLVLQCLIYADRHNGQFPDKLEDIVTAGLITNEVFNKIVAAPGVSNGQSMFRYQNSGSTAESSSNAVILYEAYDKWPDDGIVAGFGDGHAEIIKHETDFLKLISK